jgi:predicted alpha/beta superfamily hydrolase
MRQLLRSLFTPLAAALIPLAAAHAQLTLKVTSIPVNTPPGASIYVAGTFNNWNPGDATKVLTPLGNGQYSITLNPPAGEVKYKFTRGNWQTVEGNAAGSYLPDRVFHYSGQPTTVELTILSWEDLVNPSSTAAPNVVLLDDDFYMPQLNRARRILVYLPPDYQTGVKKYPVLYMHDGQNLFDKATAPFGEWEVDESLNKLHQQGDYGCIVVGIDNGPGRLDEYSPWFNTQYNAGGEGDEYVAFIVNTLKPHIDSVYRTLPGRFTTGIMGSSMGGLISMYALAERQDVFSKAGIFSPAFWFGGDNPAVHVAGHPKQADARVYFLAGGSEPAYVEQDMQEVADAMTTAGFGPQEKYFTVPPDGQHTESFWRSEFSDAYLWLFAGAVSSANAPDAGEPLDIFPNPAGSWVRISGLKAGERADVQVYTAAGKRLRNATIRGDEPLWTGDLAPGFYILKIRKEGGRWKTKKLTRL